MTPLHALALATTLVGGVLLTAQVHDEWPGNSSTRTVAVARPAATPDVAAVRFREITIPEGTVLPIALDSYVASDTSRVEDAVRAHVRRPIVVQGVTVIPAGSALTGYVTSVTRSGRIKGRGQIAFRFSRLTLPAPNERLNIRTSAVARRAPATKGRDATKIAVPAAGGAVVGAIVAGKKGAAVGAAAGGGAGTVVVLSTRGREVRLGRGAVASVRLLQPATIRVRI